LNFVSSITLQYRDLVSQGMAQTISSVTQLQSSLNDINPAGLAGLSALAIDIPAPEIGQPVVPLPEVPGIDIPTPDIGRPDIPIPDNPGIDIPTPEIGQPVIPMPDIPQPAIPAPDVSLFKQGLEEIQAGLDKIAANNALNTLATQLSVMSMAMGPIQQSLNNMMEQPSKLAGSFESSMKNIQAITGATGAEIDALSGELLTIGGKSAAGPLAVADAFNDVAGGIAMASPGVALLDVQMQVLTNSLALAEAGQADLGTAAEGLTKIMNSYRFTMGSVEEVNEQAAWASDVMTQAVGMGMGSMQEFISAMAPLSGAAASVGVGFDEIGSTLAYMTSTTDTAATAGTKLEAFMIALQKPSDALSSALERMGYTSGTAMLAELGLAESARVVSTAFGGNQDAITQAMGRAEAMKAVISLTGEAYGDFAVEFGQAMQTAVTAEAQAVQQQSYESKVARLQAATGSLQIQIGDDINAIKGFFVDMGAGFLTHAVSPIMSSPIGGVFQGVAAVAGVAGQSLLGFAGTGLSTMSTITMLAANIQNLGGVSKILHGTLDVMKAPLGAMKTGLQNLIAPMIAKITTTYAMTAAESGHAAALWAAAGAGWAAVAPLLPFVAIGVLVISVIKEIASNWGSVTAAFESGGILGAIKQIGALLISGLLAPVQGLLEMLSNIPGLGNLAGKGADKIQEFRNSLTGSGAAVNQTQTTAIEAAAPSTIDTSTLQSDIAGLQSQIGVTLTPEFAVPGSSIPVPSVPASDLVTATSSSGSSLAMEHIEAAKRKGVAASDISYTAASAFESAGAYAPPVTAIEAAPPIDWQQTAMAAASNLFLESFPVTATAPTVDVPDIDSEARVKFAEAMPSPRQTVIANAEQERSADETPRQNIFHITNMNFNADELRTLFDFVRQLELAVTEPEAVTI
jgi:TP901 family phage tail tape measure protein